MQVKFGNTCSTELAVRVRDVLLEPKMEEQSGWDKVLVFV